MSGVTFKKTKKTDLNWRTVGPPF